MPVESETTMHLHNEMTRLAAEIAALESETFEIADYAEDTILYSAGSAACSAKCSCSCLSGSSTSG
jgi:thiazolylpeptide-type bacteriocin precursor